MSSRNGERNWSETEGDWIQLDEHVSFDRSRPLGTHKSNVFFGHFTNNAQKTTDVAVKFIRKNERSMREAQCLQNLKHDNIVRIHWCGDCKLQEHDFYVALELCDKNLKQAMEDDKAGCHRNCRQIFLAIIKGLMYLHSNGILHRDIRPSNILINKDGHYVIADFDLSKVCLDVHSLSESSLGICGFWSAPELHKSRKASAKGDLFSAVLILFRLITGKHAFQYHVNVDGEAELDSDAEPKLDLINNTCCHISELAQDLIEGVLRHNPEDRTSFPDVLDHPYLLSDVNRKEFVLMLYSLIENLPKFPIRRTKKQKSPRVNVKQCLNKPAKEVVGDSWHEKLKLTDEEMEICKFKTPLCTSKKPPGKDDIKFYQQLADIENKKRCAIYNFARQKDSDEKSKEGAGSDKILKEEEAKGCHSRVKPYDFSSPYHLLRTIRNLFTHPSKCNGDIKTITEKIGIWKFIDPRFPTFFLYIWNITMKEPFPEIKELRDQYRSHEVGRNQTALQHENQSPSPSNGPLLPEHRMKTKPRLPLLSRNQNIETHTPPSVRDQAPISSLDEETVDLSDLFGETEPSSGHTVANLNLRC